MSKPVLNIAHRGASAYAHENTVEAIEKAVELGADMVEFDLRQTADGVIVLWHEDKVQNLNRRCVPIAETSLDDLYMFSRENGFRPARFDEVLREFGARTPFVIEIKTGGFEIEAVYLLKKYPPAFPPIVSSFHRSVIRRIKELDDSIKTGLIVGNNRLLKIDLIGRTILRRLALKSRADSFHLNCDVASRPLINELTDLGLEIYIWTVNDEKNMMKFINLGVDGIITDKPDLLNSVKGKI